MKRYILFITILLLIYQVHQAQPYYFRHYQVENGLSNNTVFCSVQDKNGFLWFGTKDGLNRFDGYQFKIFNIVSDNESSLSRDQISSLITDHNGTLWVGGQKGLFTFDVNKEKLVRFLDNLYDINDLFFDNSGQLWFLSGFNVCRYNFKTKQLKVFPADRFFYTTTFCQTEDGTMWFATKDGYLFKFNAETETFHRYSLFSNSTVPASNWIEKIQSFGKNTIYIGTSSQGIKKFNTIKGTYLDVLTYNPDKTTIYVRDILPYSESELWFATESGIYILNKNTGKITNLKKKALDPYSLSDNAIYSLYKDREGGMWAGTYFGGVNYYPRQVASFRKYYSNYSKNSISGNVVREICKDNYGNLWFATEDEGLNVLNLKNGSINHFLPTGSKTNISYTNIHGLLLIGDRLWIGTFEHGLDIMDVRTRKVVRHYSAGNKPNDLKSNFIVTLLQLRKGEIYLGTSNGLYRYNQQSDDFTQIKGLPDNIFISALQEDHKGTIWIGTHDQGIFYLNPETKRIGSFKNDPIDRNSVTTNTINAILEDSNKNLWFATEGGGICKLDLKTTKFTRYTTSNGLPSNFTFKALEDNKRNLWITTSKGLVCLNPKNKKINIYTSANGLLNDQFNYNSGYKDEKGNIYFGSVKGMITFNPDDFYYSSFMPPIFITGFQVHNRELEIAKNNSPLNKSVIYTDKITLPYDQSSFSIDFAAVSFTSPEMTEYSYKMKGLDRNWTYIKSNRKVYFTNLSPGKYTFKVKAAVNGIWNPNIKTLTVVISPPFWATRWAYLVYVLLGIGILYYLVREYHKRIEAKKEKEIYEAKIAFFTNIAHEIKTPLTLIKGPIENLSEMIADAPQIKDDVATMNRNTDRLINLINQILDFRKTETKSFSLSFTRININEIITEEYISFEPLAKKRGLHYDLKLPSKNIYTFADAEALQKIFSNLFSNAVKYAETKVNIQLFPLEVDGKNLIIEVMSDGNTIPEEMQERIFEPFYRLNATSKQKGTGLGLALARSLAELHKGMLYLKNTQSESNTFVFCLPLIDDDVVKKQNRIKNTLVNTD